MAKGWAILMYICSPLLIALFVFLLFMPLIPSMKADVSPNAVWFLAPFSIIMLTIFVIGLLDTIKGKFVIEKSRIYSVTTLSNRELLLHEIKGYRTNDKFIVVEPKNKDKKNIKISKYFGKTSEITDWLVNNNYPDLDLSQEIEERKAILKNQEFGWNEAEREKKLLQARRVSKIINIIGSVVGAWLLFYPKPYEFAILPTIIFPIICLFVLRYFRGLIKIDEKKNSAYPSIFWGFFATVMALFLRSLLDFQIMDYSGVWIPLFIIAAIYIVLLLFCTEEARYDKASDYLGAFGVLIIVFSYAYGSFVTVNCVFDQSEPEVFNATILDKTISSGKSKSHYLELTPWGPRTEAERVMVPKSFYESHQIKDEVTVYLMKGKFDIPWYEVASK